ncbi:nicotinate-nucleotide--dimethylbenzimidazole phosphoribosyltransferase [Litorivivens sp.]|uniref:nicotinate-nucleotide--dimethylbenzimidazole phosphoribosyltransferase n=1 Tax=Litorivivens sp. TaxID=2020868 RepID=UPI0035664AE6
MRQDWWFNAIPPIDTAAQTAARQRQEQLTKPAGALGQLEGLAVRLAALQSRQRPGIETIKISVFAADHGIASEAVSAFPQAVTAQMIMNFAHGGAAISVLAKALDAELEIINLGTVAPVPEHPLVRKEIIAPGTANILHQAAMSDVQLRTALASGHAAAERAHGADLFIAGEMGIGNTSSATALACAILQRAPADLVGPGTGLDVQGVARKTRVIQQALERHQAHCVSPYETLRQLGGFEIAAMVGAYIRCAQLKIPVLVDGFIATAAALLACHLNRTMQPWLLYAHRSAEPGHAAILEALNAKALLDLGLRLGEGSGAAVAVPLLQLACSLHGQMATFAEAGVAGEN